MAGDVAGRLVVAEDHPNVRMALEHIFRRAGYHVTAASDGPAALSVVRQVRPDLLVLDVDLPGMSGLRVCRSVRADPELATMAVLMVSGWA